MKKEEITKFLNTILKWSILCAISDDASKKDFRELGSMVIMFMMAHNIEIEDKDKVNKSGARNEN